jgi:hypothetical protein
MSEATEMDAHTERTRKRRGQEWSGEERRAEQRETEGESRALRNATSDEGERKKKG